MSAHTAAESLKQQIPLLDYLVSQHWQPARRIARGRLMGPVRCTLTAGRVCWWIPARACSTAMAVAAAATSSVSSNCFTECGSEKRSQSSAAGQA